MRGKLFNFVSYVITFLCLLFVIYKAQECFAKFLDKPESTDVLIEHAAKHDYPTISVCLNDIDSFHAETLKKCNLTVDDYKYNNIWVGNNQTHEFCNDPLKLYEEMTGNPSDSLINSIYGSNDDIDSFNLTYNTIDISKWDGRCFTYERPKNTALNEITVEFWNDAFVYVHSPGSFFGTDFKVFKVARGLKVKIDVIHEVFEVLDFDGQDCKKYPFGRDACIFDKIHKVIHINRPVWTIIKVF